MITKETIEKVLDAARIEEVVGDFVDLKKKRNLAYWELSVS